VKVSLVATVRNAHPAVERWLESVRRQTRPPDEVVVVDGGSTDGTLAALRAAPDITVVEAPGANIARGRNLAVRAAAHDVIAVSDGDCVLAEDWLERILRPIEAGGLAAAGFYRPLAGDPWQVFATSHLPDAEEVGRGWMPSSRSLAFRREAFEAAGGYPEWLAIGEDMYLNHRWRDLGIRIERAVDAVVWWPPRPTPAATWRQYAGYAEGDAMAGMYPERHAVRFAAYGLLLAALLGRRPRLLAMLAAAGALYVRRPVGRARRRLPPGSPARLAAPLGVPAAIAFLDAAKMAGYLRGLRARRRPGPERGAADPTPR
jgi:glycosyltransferase involved in cell wall biosynthesis